MKKLLSISFVFLLSIFSTACGGNSTDEGSPTKKSSGIFSSGKMTQQEGMEKMNELTEKLISGEITKEEFEKQNDELAKNTETSQEMMKRINDYSSDFDGLPSWAKEIGMLEVEGLQIDQSRSDIAKAVPDKHIPASFTAYYTGSAEDVLKEGKRLAEALKLKDMFNIEGAVMANGEVDGYSVGVSVRTDVDEPFLSYSAGGKSE